MKDQPESNNPTDILRWLGSEFVALRQKHPKKAWTFYRDGLMRYQAELYEVISIESIIERAMKIETFVSELKETVVKHELSQAEALEGMRALLRSKDTGKDTDREKKTHVS